MATFEFDRYINGVLMAEGVTIERQPNLECAMRVAAHIASRGPNGEAPVLVLRTPQPAAQPGVVKEAVRRELADVEASLDDAISYLVDLAGAKPTPMSPQNCRIHIDHARMSARNLAALAAPVSQEPVIKPVDYEKIDIPADIREFGERHKIPEFANATYRNGYVDGYRFAVNEADRDRLAARKEPKK